MFLILIEDNINTMLITIQIASNTTQGFKRKTNSKNKTLNNFSSFISKSKYNIRNLTKV